MSKDNPEKLEAILRVTAETRLAQLSRLPSGTTTEDLLRSLPSSGLKIILPPDDSELTDEPIMANEYTFQDASEFPFSLEEDRYFCEGHED